MKTKRTYSLAPDVVSALAEEPNASAYIEALVRCDRLSLPLWRCPKCDYPHDGTPDRRCPACGVLLVSEMETVR